MNTHTRYRTAGLSSAEKRLDNTNWFTCCGQTWRHYSMTSRDYCPRCGDVVEGGDHPDDTAE
jgi:hypothetical protein